ncbi:P-like protein, partial [Dinothrombium tinctorium]|uniref:p-like protein n=1 Tax=Dinothrombium tinctorium TaxID=1965070 RepID=A0A3S3NQP6_9ACAR
MIHQTKDNISDGNIHKSYSVKDLQKEQIIFMEEHDEITSRCKNIDENRSWYNNSSKDSFLDSMDSHNCSCCHQKIDTFNSSYSLSQKKKCFSFSFGAATEKTPLVNSYEMSSYGIINEENASDGTLKSDFEDSHTDNADECQSNASQTEGCSFFRQIKIFILCGFIAFTLASFIMFREKHEVWSNVSIRFGFPVYINISDYLEELYPVWTIKAKGPFLPQEYRNLTKFDAYFTIVKQLNGSRRAVRTPWIAPVAPYETAQQIGITEITHSFNMDESDALFGSFERDSDAIYQLEVSTSEMKPISIQVSVAAYSKLSLKGIIFSVFILVLLYSLIVFEIVHRTLAAMIGATVAIACLTIIGDRPALEKVVSWLDIETLSLLFGMMIIVAILCETGFFDYVAVLAFRLANGETWPLIIILCFFTAILSAFLDNVTTVLLMTPVTIRLCEIKNIEPKHVLIAQVIFSNIGGAATPIGDPPNVIIISNAKINAMGVGFASFTCHMMPGIIVCLIATVFLLRFMYRDLNKLSFQEPPEIMEVKREIDVWKKACSSIAGYSRDENSVRVVLRKKVLSLETLLSKQLYNTKPSHEEYRATLAELKTKYRIKNKPLLIKSASVMAIVISLFFLQSIPRFDISLGWIAILGAIVLLILADFEEIESIIARVEWSTLIFFAALFVVMEALSELKFLMFIGEITQNVINSVDEQHRLIVSVCLMLWVSALASSFIDNIPFATVMVKIIQDLAESKDFNLPMTPLIYALAFGACLGGNGTLIGASANVVCAGVAEQHGYRFTFMDFFKIGFPVMLVTTIISNAYLLLCHIAFEWH